ncbi:MAG: DUF2914 domain-containing protein [Elusimicrobiota bacterium]
MKREHPSIWTGLALAAALAAGAAGAQEAAEPATLLGTSVIAQGVENKAPFEPAWKFPASVGSLVCWTEVKAAEAPTTIVFLWRHKDRDVYRSVQPVKRIPWRTWSRKDIPPSASGPWSVEIQDEKGAVLKTLGFMIEPASRPADR